MYGYTYRTTCKTTGRVYIGQKRRGFDPSYLGSGLQIRRAVAKHGPESFMVEILDTAENRIDLNKYEQRSIIEHRSFLGRANVMNITPGGEGCGKGVEHPSFGRKASVEERRLRSEARKGPLNPNYGKDFSGPKNAHFGHKHSAETKARIGAANRLITGAAHGNFGKVRSAETRAKISASKRRAKP